MKIKSLFSASIIISIVMSAVVVVTILMMLSSNSHLEHALQYELQAFELASEMEESSEDLTNYIRLYAMTGDTTYRSRCLYLSFSLLFFASLLFTAICKSLLRQPFCFFGFLFHGDGLDPCLLYNVTNLLP